MHVRTVQSFRVNTLHAVVSFHSASKYLVPESPQPEREGSGRIYILATCPNRDRPRHLSRRTTPSPAQPGHHREYIASEGLTTYSRACVHHPRWSTRRRSVGRRSLSLPREGAWIAKLTFSTGQPPAKVLAVGSARAPRAGTINCPTARALAASSRSGLNVTPRPAPRPRHGQPATANTSPRPPLHEVRFDNTVGADGGRRGADPAELGTHSEHFSPIPPPVKGEGRLDNTEGAASRASITSSSDTMRPSANRHKTHPTTPPAAARGSSAHDHAGHWAPQPTTRTSTSSNRDSGSRRPEARRRDSEVFVKPVLGKPAAGDTVSPRGD